MSTGPYGSKVLSRTEADRLRGFETDLFTDITLEPKETESRSAVDRVAPAEERGGPVPLAAQHLLARAIRQARTLPHPVSHYSQDLMDRCLVPLVDPLLLLDFVDGEPHLRACCDVKADDASRMETVIKARFAKKCLTCGHEHENEVELCERCTGAVRSPDTRQEALLQRILDRPNPTMTWKDIRRSAMWFLEAVDDVWIEARWNAAGRPEFWPASPETMRFLRPDRKVYICSVCGQTGEEGHFCRSHSDKQLQRARYAELKDTRSSTISAYFLDQHMVHYNRYGSRYYGNPPTWTLRNHLRALLESVLYNADAFQGREIPNKIIGVEGASEAVVDRLEAKWKNAVEANQHWSAVVNAKVSTSDVFPSNKDMQFREMFILYRNTVMAVMKTPLLKLGISETGGAGMVVGWQLIGSYWDTVEDGIEQFDEAMNQFLGKYCNITDYYLESETARPFDTEKIHEDQRQDIIAGLKSINEVRQERGLDAYKDADGKPEPAWDRPLIQPPGNDVLPPVGGGGELPHGTHPPTPTYLTLQPGEVRMPPRATPTDANITGVATAEARFTERLKREYRKRVLRAIDRGEELDQDDLLRLFDKTFNDLEASYERLGQDAMTEAYQAGVKQGTQDLGIEFEWGKADQAAVDYLNSKEDGMIQQLKHFNEEQRSKFESIIRDAYADPEKFSHYELTRRMKDVVAVEDFKLERIARSETTLISNMARDRSYQIFEAERGEELLYDWVGPDDPRTSDICKWIKAEIRRKKGKRKGVTRSELREIMDEAVRRFGTGGQWLRPHVNCRHTIVRTV